MGVGIALNNKYLNKTSARTYVVLGDGESVEGSVWEAADIARHFKLDNLCGIVNVNRLGQSDPTMPEHDLTAYQARWEAFGWHAICVDGHNHSDLLKVFAPRIAENLNNHLNIMELMHGPLSIELNKWFKFLDRCLAV